MPSLKGPASGGNAGARAQRKAHEAALLGEGWAESAGPRGPLGVWSLPKEKGPSRGFRRRRLHQSHVLERSLTAGWRTAQRGQNQIKLEAGGRGGGGWDSPGLARSPGPSQEASQVPSLWALLAAETVCRAHHPEGPPPSSCLPTDGRVKFSHAGVLNPQGWATLCSPRKHPLLMHPSTAASKAPFTWPLALHPLCPVRTHGPPPHFTGEGATPREGPTDPCLLPPWSPPTGLPARHPLPLSDQRRMLSPSQEQGCLLFKTSRPWGMPTGPPPPPLPQVTPGGCGARRLEPEWPEPLSTRPRDSCAPRPRLCRLNSRLAIS